MGLSELKIELKKMNKEELLEMVYDLYKHNKGVKDFLDYHLNSDSGTLFNKYKERINEAFFPKRGYKVKLAQAKKAISEFKKIGTKAEYLADLMFYYVETGIKYGISKGSVKDALHNSLVSNFKIAFKFIEKENITDKYLASAAELIDSSKKISSLLNNDFTAIFSIYND